MKRTTLVIASALGAVVLTSAGGICRAGGEADAQVRAHAAEYARAAGSGGCDHCRAEFFAIMDDDAKARRRPAFDEASGRRLANYPPHRIADIEHLRLDLSIDDMNTPTLNGVETLTLTPTGWPLEELRLSALAMKIVRVESPGRDASFEHDGETLRIRLTPPPAPGERATVITTYTVADPPAGLVWTPESRAWPARPAQIHTQGQPQSNAYWFPCHDFPNERLTTELRVTVPQGYDVCSNGRLLARDRVVRTTKNKLGTPVMVPAEAFHWIQDQHAGGGHVSYLVSMVVGKFDVVDVGSQSLPMPVYVPRGRGSEVQGTFGRTPAMADMLGERLSEPYPWSRYAQCVVWNFAAGGMENTGATTLYDSALIAPEAIAEFDLDGLISHELGHQWFGDLITCNSWEHVWLNEGFATFASALWAERRPGPEGGSDAYQSNVRAYMDGVIAADRPDAPYTQAMVSKAYEHPWETFRRSANPYTKGASVLHMLRARFGDDLFFRCIAEYVDRHKHRTVETSDLRSAFEDLTGESLQQFFAQWCYRPGVPTLKVEPSYNAATGQLTVSVEQIQNINADNPAFEFVLPVWIGGNGSSGGTWLNIDVQGRKASGTLVAAEEPAVIAVDPGMSVLAGLKIALSPGRWLAQLRHGPTHASRVQAARALGAMGLTEAPPEARALLASIAMDRAAFAGMRAECVRALAAMRDIERVETLAAAQLTPASVREAAVQALGDAASSRQDTEWAPLRARATDLLAELAERDPSVKARAAAVTALGALKARNRVAPVLAAARTSSQDDVLRIAALGALGDMPAATDTLTVIGLTQNGVLSRTRAKAAETLGRMGATGRDAAFKRLAELLDDREIRVRGAARSALVELADPRGIAELERALGDAAESERSDIKDCARRLRQKLTPASPDSKGG